MVSSGLRRACAQIRREASLLRHIEEAFRLLWTITKFNAIDGKNRASTFPYIWKYLVGRVHGAPRRGEDLEGCVLRFIEGGEGERHSLDSLGYGLNRSAPDILQGCRSLEYAIPSERLETCWGSGKYGGRTVHHIRMDATWEHREVYQK